MLACARVVCAVREEWLYDRRSVVRSSDVKRLDGDSEARGGRMDTVTH
jgi:hypothetical protein